MNQLDAFSRVGNEMSRIEWFSTEKFATYGVRDFTIASSQICCVDTADDGCHQPARECF